MRGAPIQRKPEVTLRITRPDGSITEEAWPVVQLEDGNWEMKACEDDRFAGCEIYMTIKQSWELPGEGWWAPLKKTNWKKVSAGIHANGS